MLMGESKPYCSAIAWVDKTLYTQTTLTAIDQAMEEMNKYLSNPEKIKRWAICSQQFLSIKTCELTPNLKLKRNVVIPKIHEKSSIHSTQALPLKAKCMLAESRETG